MAPLFHVHLKQVAHVVERRRRPPQQALLLDGGGLGVALRDDDPAQHVAMLARHLVPYRLIIIVAKTDFLIGLTRIQEYAPAIFGHLHIIEMGPAVGIDRYGGAQINILFLISLWPHLLPPLEII